MLRVLAAVLGVALLLAAAVLFLRVWRGSDVARQLAPATGAPAPQGDESSETPDAHESRRIRVEPAAPDEPGPSGRDGVSAGAEPGPCKGVLAGRVLQGDGPPSESIELVLAPSSKEWNARPEAAGVVATDSRGYFRREGLPDDWSGVLRIPAPFRAVQGDGSHARVVRVEALREDLRIEVVRLPSLRGRLVLPGGGSDAELTLDVALHWGDGSSLKTVTRSREDGRFVVELARDDLVRAALDGMAESGDLCDVDLPRDALRHDSASGDFDAGDLRLERGFRGHLRTRDPQGEPVQGASLAFEGSSMRSKYTTDGNGEVRFPVSRALSAVRIHALGFATETLPAPAGPERVDVVLRPTNRLTVIVTDSRGDPWRSGLVRLRCAGPLYESRERLVPGELVRGLQQFDHRGNVDEQGPYHLFVTDDDGVVEVQGLSVAAAITVSALDELEVAGARASVDGLAAEERRQVHLKLPEPPERVRGRCVDRAGVGVAEAEVSFHAGGVSSYAICDAEGAFTGPSTYATELAVRAMAPSLVQTALVPVFPGQRDVVLTLEEGRPLDVELRDELGASVSSGDLVARLPGTQRTWSGSRRAAGSGFSFPSLPFEPLELEYAWAGRNFRWTLDARQEQATFEVPPMGTLTVTFKQLRVEKGEWFQVEMRSIDAPELGLLTGAPALGGRIERPLWPGRYRVQLTRGRDERDGSRSAYEPYLEPVTVDVRAGETTLVELGLRAGDG